ncbi:hypothetical protein U3516DRAFT_667119 [Neocallimastix sp. 'constans']
MARITDAETIYCWAYSTSEDDARKLLQESHRALGFFLTLVQIEKLPKNPEPIGIVTSSIVQVLSDVEPPSGLIYKLPLTLGNTTFESEFRLIEKDDLLFDIIIFNETIIENYLFINPVKFELCIVNSNLKLDRIKHLFKEVKE